MRLGCSKIMALGVIVCGFSQLAAEEWAQFRGPASSGVVASGAIATEWGPDKNIQWKVEIPGVAWSSPIVWGDKVFVTTAITEKQNKPQAGGGFGGGFGPPGGFGPGGFGPGGRGPRGAEGDSPQPRSADKDADKEKGKDEKGKDDKSTDRPRGPRPGGPGGFGGGGFGGGRPGGFGPGGMGTGGPPPDVLYRWELHCLDRNTGKTLWKQVAAERKPSIPTHRSNTYASETPVADGECVYAYFGMHGLFCYDFEGKLIWKKDLGSFPMMAGWGTGSSPALDGDRLFVQCDNEEKSFLVALNKMSGDELWRVERKGKSTWSTPFIWRTKDRTEVVAAGGNRVISYDVASGKILWDLAGFVGQASATPVAGDGLLYVGAGGPMGNSPLFAIKEGATGDISLEGDATANAGIAWSRTKAGPSMASPLLYKGYLYILEQRTGMISCYHAKTGEQAYYRQRLDSRGFTSSPWASDDKVYCLDESGQTVVVKAGPEFAVVGQNKLDEMCWSSPAIAAGSLLLRGVDHLFCIK